MIKKIGILTSGGDSPGMNSAIIGAIRAGYNLGKEMYVIYDGYKGLVEGNIQKVGKDFAKFYASMGGTIIKTARLPEFKELSVQKKAVENLKKVGIDALIVIGGDGSYIGAKKLTELGINCVGLPGTIDNDIASTDYTIGFDTALNTIVNSIDAIRDTMSSLHRCCVVEIMGNRCGDLTIFSGIATHADFIITNDRQYDPQELVKELNELKKTKPDHIIILISEKIMDLNALVKTIQDGTGISTRGDVLGYIQRGGRPSAMERFNSTRMGVYAVELLDKGIGGVCVGIVNNQLHYQEIYEALKKPRDKHENLYHSFDLIK